MPATPLSPCRPLLVIIICANPFPVANPNRFPPQVQAGDPRPRALGPVRPFCRGYDQRRLSAVCRPIRRRLRHQGGENGSGIQPRRARLGYLDARTVSPPAPPPHPAPLTRRPSRHLLAIRDLSFYCRSAVQLLTMANPLFLRGFFCDAPPFFLFPFAVSTPGSVKRAGPILPSCTRRRAGYRRRGGWGTCRRCCTTLPTAPTRPAPRAPSSLVGSATRSEGI